MSVLKVKDNGVWKDVPSIKGETGDAAGFGTATASVDTGTGTPSCVVTLSGDDTAKNFDFAFHNLMYDDSDLQSDFADLADDFDVLQRQFDTAVAALTVDSEVADIRVGDDGVTYASAGAAVRGQFHDVKSAINNLNGIEFSVDNYFINLIGNPSANNDYHITDFILLMPDCAVGIRDCFAGSSSFGIAFYTASKEFISGINSINGDYTVLSSSVPSNAKYVRFGSAKTYDNKAYNSQAFITNTVEIVQQIGGINTRIDSLVIEPKETTFFDGINYYDIENATYYSDRFIDFQGYITATSSVNTIVFPVKPNTDYYIHIPNSNRGIVGESSTNNFSAGTTVTVIYSSGSSDGSVIHFTTGSTANYVGIYFYSGSYDYDTKKTGIILNVGQYYGDINPFIPNEYLPSQIGDVLENAQILIFGDSITDCCNLTINSNKETTAYVWRNPSNSYVDGGGNTVQFSMWPKILKNAEPLGETRNYAQYGASYKTASRQSGEERQNLHYQIDVALNDLDNPNNVFSVDNYVPDIVIFALGTNDGTPNDTYESAMSKTVYKGDGVSIDTAATMAALDTSKFCESARCAFMRIKTAFPMAQIYCVLPIQRADNDMLYNNHNYLKQMAERYGCIIIDGAESVGITRDFNNWSALGTYLKDGLHPNEKGQNLMARAIISSLKSHYIPFGSGFNLLT